MDPVQEIPLFPLTSVLFPAGRLPLRVFEPRYVEMTKACLRDGSVFGVVLIKAGFEVGRSAIPHQVGCTARIVDWEAPAPGLFTLTVQGESLFRILERWVTSADLGVAKVRILEPPDPLPVPPRHRVLARLLGELGEDYFPAPHRPDDAAWVGNRLCELLPLVPERKQKLLELNDPLAMLDEVARLLKQLRAER